MKNTEEAVAALLKSLNVSAPKETPARVAKSLAELVSGRTEDPIDVLKVFDVSNARGVVTTKGIEFVSLCEHHLLPFFGTVEISYRANGKLIGASKLARVVDVLARRLQLQERLTEEIATVLESCVAGVRVKTEAKHLCMMARGVRQAEAVMEYETRRGDIE